MHPLLNQGNPDGKGKLDDSAGYSTIIISSYIVQYKFSTSTFQTQGM